MLATLSGLVLGACVNRAPPGETPEAAAIARQEAAVQGVWNLRRVSPGQAPGAGIQLDVRIDSVGPPGLYGAMTHFFAGDVGLDHTRFSRFDGLVTADSLVSLTIGTADDPPASISIAGVLRSDTIHVTQLVLGVDTLTGRSRSWVMLRADRR